MWVRLQAYFLLQISAHSKPQLWRKEAKRKRKKWIPKESKVPNQTIAKQYSWRNEIWNGGHQLATAWFIQKIWPCPWELHGVGTVRGTYIRVGRCGQSTWEWDGPWGLHKGGTVRCKYIKEGPSVLRDFRGNYLRTLHTPDVLVFEH